MDVPKGVAMKPPRVLFISLWGLLIFGVIKTSHHLHQWSLSSNFVKDKDLPPDYSAKRETHDSKLAVFGLLEKYFITIA